MPDNITPERSKQLYAARKKKGKLGGRKKGTKNPKTLELEKVQEEVKQQIIKRAMPLVRAAMLPALGQNFIYRIDEEEDSKGKVTSRKHVLVVDPEEIAEALDQMEEGGTHPDDAYYYVTAKEPDYKAIEMLMSRAFGKPKETIDANLHVKFSLKGLADKRKTIEGGKFEVLPATTNEE